LEKLELGTQYKLVLIVAPPGSGKEELLRKWVQNRVAASPIPPSWVNIDTEDNNPAHFLSKLISALIVWGPEIEDHIDIQHTYGQIQLEDGSPKSISIQGLQQSIENFLTSIINSLITLEGERFLILNNYHYITNPEIQAMMAYFIDYLPKNLHLIITSLEYPPLQFPRLRVRRELLEIGPDDMNQSP
jgi:LuxR family maltose regulon positive regulatory protein